jgi:uncharacterized coiled-coil protein SlyX
MTEQNLTDLRARMWSTERTIAELPGKVAALEASMKENSEMHKRISEQLDELLKSQAERTGAQKTLTALGAIVTAIFGAGAGVAFDRLSGGGGH